MIKLIGFIVMGIPTIYAFAFIIKGIREDVKHENEDIESSEHDEEEDFIRTFLSEEEADDLIYNIMTQKENLEDGSILK